MLPNGKSECVQSCVNSYALTENNINYCVANCNGPSINIGIYYENSNSHSCVLCNA